MSLIAGQYNFLTKTRTGRSQKRPSRSKQTTIAATFLELDPQSKLNFARVDSETGDLAKVSIPQRCSRIAKLRMVPHVEHLGAEFELRVLRCIPARVPPEPGELGDFEDGQIPVVDSRAANRVSSSVTESAQSWLGKSAGFEPFIQGPLGPIQDGIANDIRAFTNSGITQARLVVLEADVERTPGTERGNAVDLPSGS